MAYDNTNRGSLWVNDRKDKDTHPDRTGTINVEGVEYFIDGWLKETSAGKKFLSLSVKRKGTQGGAAKPQNRPPGRPQPPQGQRPATPGARPQPPASSRPAPPTDPEPEWGDQNAPDADKNF